MPECAESSWEECRTALSQTDCCLGQKLELTITINICMYSVVVKVYCYIKCRLWIRKIKLDSMLSWTALSFELALYVYTRQRSALRCRRLRQIYLRIRKNLLDLKWLMICEKKKIKYVYHVLLVLQPFSIFPQTPDPYSSVIFVTFLLLILVLHYYIFW